MLRKTNKRLQAVLTCGSCVAVGLFFYKISTHSLEEGWFAQSLSLILHNDLLIIDLIIYVFKNLSRDLYIFSHITLFQGSYQLSSWFCEKDITKLKLAQWSQKWTKSLQKSSEEALICLLYLTKFTRNSWYFKFGKSQTAG